MSRLLIDTNILLLYVVGRHDAEQIARFKRTRMFNRQDFELLAASVAPYPTLVVTAGVLAEVSNLLPDWLHQGVSEQIKGLVAAVEEHTAPARQIVQDDNFGRFGFADCSILWAATEAQTTVLTDDLQLHLQLLARGCTAINFNHLRGT